MVSSGPSEPARLQACPSPWCEWTASILFCLVLQGDLRSTLPADQLTCVQVMPLESSSMPSDGSCRWKGQLGPVTAAGRPQTRGFQEGWTVPRADPSCLRGGALAWLSPD